MNTLVTGGGGFLGKAIVARLLERGDRVAIYARGDYPELKSWGVEVVRGDLADAGTVSNAMRGRDRVFHTAAKAGIWGRRADFFRTNVAGTENVVKACQRHGVGVLVYTSSPSVIHCGDDICGLDEGAPYPEKFEAPYPETKAAAERIVLEANNGDLSTCSLRPHLIWGPGDTNIVPRLLERARSGRLLKIKGGPYMVDTIYIDNAVDAHLLAAERLSPDSPTAGRAYFISQDEPVDIGRMIDLIIGTAGFPPVRRTVPLWAAHAAGWVFEMLYTVFRRESDPPVTRFAVKQLATDHWFDISAARRDLGYHPRISIEEGLARLKAHLAEFGY